MLERREHLLGFDIRLILGRVHKTTPTLRHWRNARSYHLRVLWEQLMMSAGVRCVTCINATILLWSRSYCAHLIISSTFTYRWDFRRKYLWVCHRILLTVNCQLLLFRCFIKYHTSHWCRLVCFHRRTESVKLHYRVSSGVFITWKIRSMLLAATTRNACVSSVWP